MTRTVLGVALAALAAPLAAAGRAAEPGGAVPRMDHVIVVIMENKTFDQVRGLPYTARLIAASSSFSNSYAITHPSQPNYLALWAGSTFQVGDNECPPRGSPYASENLGHACESARLTWKAYSEDLPGRGSPACTHSGTLYTRKHDPWTDFSNLDHRNEVPFTQLAIDLAGRRLPNLAFVVPNNCHNTHDALECPPATGDAWLAANLPGMISAAGPHGLVILTWDEDDDSGDNRILTVFAGPLVKPGYVSSRRIDHYSVLRTICDALRLEPFGAARSGSAVTDVWRPSPQP